MDFVMRSLVPIWLLVAGTTLPYSTAHASSAFAFDTETKAYAYVYGSPSESQARGEAVARCLRYGGVQCDTILSCAEGGYGALYFRQASPGAPREAFGATCGADSDQAARDQARKTCEFEYAKQLGALPDTSEDLPWSVIQDALRQNCPGLGNCQCGDGESWYDAVQ